MHWPKHIERGRGVRGQYHHVSDIAPTLYEVLGIEVPREHRGAPQLPIHGTSLAYTLLDGDAPTRKHTQYFEILGDRAIWHRGWKAVSRHVKGTDFEADRWELYCLDRDFAEINDLAQSEQGRLRDLMDLWWVEAGKYGVLPLDDRDWERAAARLRMNTATRYEYLGNMARVDRLSAPDISDRSYAINVEFEPLSVGTEGVLIAWGNPFAGLALYIKDGELTFEYVYSESVRHAIHAPFKPKPGKVSIRLAFRRTGKNTGRVTLTMQGEIVGSVDIPRTWPTHGTTAGLNVGEDAGSPVSDAYSRPFRLTAQNLRVVVELEGPVGNNPGAAYQAALREQ
jgi:arylsulfatase